MAIEDFRGRWMYYEILYENGDSDYLRDIIECCLGEHKEGLLFKGKGKYAGQIFVLKYDEDDFCYKRSADLEEKNVNWLLWGMLEYVG